MRDWEDDLDAHLGRSQGPMSRQQDEWISSVCGESGLFRKLPVMRLDLYELRFHKIQCYRNATRWLMSNDVDGWEMLRIWSFRWYKTLQNRPSNRVDLQAEKCWRHLKHLTRPRVGLRQLLKSFAPRKHYPCHGDWPCTTKIVGYAVAWCSKRATTCCCSSLCLFPTNISHEKPDYFLRVAVVIRSKPVVSCNCFRLF